MPARGAAERPAELLELGVPAHEAAEPRAAAAESRERRGPALSSS
jgi:hypothetical protein